MSHYADNTRGRILRRLAQGPATAKELLPEIGCSYDSLTCALSYLTRAGAIEAVAGQVRGDGRVKLYRIAQE